MVCGDIHRNWEQWSGVIDQYQPDMVIQVGDLGYFPHEFKLEEVDFPFIEHGIHFCDGNHEDHDSLHKGGSREISPNIYFHERGDVLHLPNGLSAMFFGGASSVDSYRRTPGWDLFPQEIPSFRDLNRALHHEGSVDIIFSHTCPNEFEVTGRYYHKDATRDALSVLLDEFHPSRWYFGHWHQHIKGTYDGTAWECLNMIPEIDWWTWL